MSLETANTQKTVIVTGGSQGIGAGLVKTFLDRGYRVVANSRNITTSGAFEPSDRDVRDQPKIADAASLLLQDVFGKEKNPSRLVFGVASLPLGTPVELEVIFEVTAQEAP